MTSTPDPTQEAIEEIARQRRLVDQMSSMHAMMRDRASLQGTALLCGLLVASVLATAFAFAGSSEVVEILWIKADRSTWLGWFAVANFSVVLIDLVVDRRGAAKSYDEAVRQLSALKAEYRRPPPLSSAVSECERLSERYDAVMAGLPALPEHQFARLKARHLEKVEVSRYLSAHPGASARQARLAVRKAAGK